MNITFNLKLEKLNDLTDQVFDYFNLAYYDLESRIDSKLNLNTIKSKFETFADKHFKSAINEFDNEIQKLKNSFPIELTKLEKISSEVRRNFNELVDYNFSNSEIINSLKSKVKDILIRIN